MCWRCVPCLLLSARFCWVHSEFRVSKDNASLKQRVSKKRPPIPGTGEGTLRCLSFPVGILGCHHPPTGPAEPIAPPCGSSAAFAHRRLVLRDVSHFHMLASALGEACLIGLDPVRFDQS